jgi:hypothetical protein
LTATNQSAKYTAPAKKPSTNPVAVTVQLETNNKEGKKSSFMLTSSISVIDCDLYILVTIDGKDYEFYQYGFNGAIPPDPNNIAVANCAVTDEGLILAGTYAQNAGLLLGFGLKLDNPTVGTKALTCYLDDGKDDIEFGIGLEGYELNYTKRQKSGDICDSEQLCGDVSVTLTELGKESYSEVAGSFSGTLYQDKDGFFDLCQSSVAHSIKGEFRLVRAY